MSSSGVAILGPVEHPAARILCLPHAGGAASTYNQWHRLVPPDVEVCAIELPGRGSRFKDAALTSMAAVVEHVSALTEPLMDVPYVLLGHSMGAVVALELARRRCGTSRPPHALVVAGCRAPYLPRPHAKPLSELPDEELVRELSRLEGLPLAMLQMPNFMKTFLPTIRADLRCREQWRDDMRQVNIPIHVLGGRGDTAVPHADMEAWKVYSARPIRLRMFDGGHFFVRENQAQVVDYLATQVLRPTRQPQEDP
jgi:surfactin synthase thioesterase subunit